MTDQAKTNVPSLSEVLDYHAIQSAYHELALATGAHHDWSIRVNHAKVELERAVAAAVCSGDIKGKNQQERDANTREMFLRLFEDLEYAESELMEARAKLDLAQVAVKEVHALMRLAEIETRVAEMQRGVQFD